MSTLSSKESGKALAFVITMGRTLLDFDGTIFQVAKELNEMIWWFL